MRNKAVDYQSDNRRTNEKKMNGAAVKERITESLMVRDYFVGTCLVLLLPSER